MAKTIESAQGEATPQDLQDLDERALSEQTPTDDPQKPRRTRKRSQKRVLGEGEGDYCIYEIAADDSDFPVGTLLKIPEIPRFETAEDSKRWIVNQSGHLLAGKRIVILRFAEVANINAIQKPVVEVKFQPKIPVPKKAKTGDDSEST